MMKTRKIGECFEYDGVTLKVVASCSCVDCYFVDTCTIEPDNKPLEAGFCSAIYRTDKKSVKFVRTGAHLKFIMLVKEHIDDLLHEAESMEEACKGKKEEDFYSGMIHGVDLLKDYIKRISKSRNS